MSGNNFYDSGRGGPNKIAEALKKQAAKQDKEQGFKQKTVTTTTLPAWLPSEWHDFVQGAGSPLRALDGTSYATVRLLVPHDKLQALTQVTFAINGRWQDDLNEESLDYILSTLKDHNDEAAKARLVKGADGHWRIDVLDGSCRLASVKLVPGVGYLVDLAGPEVTVAHAREIARKSSASREHSAAEKGKQALIMESEDGRPRNEIASLLAIDSGDLSKVMNAMEILPEELLKVFPSWRSLGVPSLDKLNKAYDPIKDDKKARNKFFNYIEERRSTDMFAKLSGDRLVGGLVSLATEGSQVARGKKKAAPVPPKTEHLWGDESGRNAFVRKVSKDKQRSVTFECRKVPDALLEDLELAVIEVLEKHLK